MVQQNSAENSSSDEDIPIPRRTNEVNALLDKDGGVWTQDPPIERRRDAANIFRETPGPTEDSLRDTVIDTWLLYLPVDLLNQVVQHSQEHADR